MQIPLSACSFAMSSTSPAPRKTLLRKKLANAKGITAALVHTCHVLSPCSHVSMSDDPNTPTTTASGTPMVMADSAAAATHTSRSPGLLPEKKAYAVGRPKVANASAIWATSPEMASAPRPVAPSARATMTDVTKPMASTVT